jgi:transcription initiation factor IIF auxiliary subunit
MDKLADGLQRLNEDDLLQVVQMVHDNKTAESYTKNDVERESSSIRADLPQPLTNTYQSEGEFHVDLYTLPDSLIKMLWDFTAERGFL